jgi:hypothetical protein
LFGWVSSFVKLTTTSSTTRNNAQRWPITAVCLRRKEPQRV